MYQSWRTQLVNEYYVGEAGLLFVCPSICLLSLPLSLSPSLFFALPCVEFGLPSSDYACTDVCQHVYDVQRQLRILQWYHW